MKNRRSSMHVERNGTVWTKEIETVKTGETHSFVFDIHYILAIKTPKFQQHLYRCNLFDTN